jgi:hypothetical protein
VNTKSRGAVDRRRHLDLLRKTSFIIPISSRCVEQKIDGELSQKQLFRLERRDFRIYARAILSMKLSYSNPIIAPKSRDAFFRLFVFGD